ncbi:MAG: hypothetical protein FIA99_14200 [Ruminiclostridium sp.]|nr:hypothetical protein [Ruminiclostridium sp.]
MPDSSKKTFRIALGGILGAMAVICLFLAAVLPTGRISLYALSSFFISIVVIENGIKAGWLFYIATTLLAVILVPDKLEIIPYAIFFGAYGIIKCHIEKIGKLIIEYIVKFAYFNLCMAAAILFIRQVFTESMKIQLPWWLIIAAFEVIFLIYDLVYTMLITYYKDKLRKKLHM